MSSRRLLVFASLIPLAGCGSSRPLSSQPSLPDHALLSDEGHHDHGHHGGHDGDDDDGSGGNDGDDDDGDDDAGNADGLPILEYLFEEGSGAFVANTGTFGGADGVRRNLTTQGAGPEFSTDVPPDADSHHSMWFDGTNDSIGIPDDFNYTVDGTSASEPLRSLTIEAWIRPASISGQRVIWDDYGNPGVLLAIWDGVVQFGVSTTGHPGMGVAIYAGRISAGEWHFVRGVYDGESLRVSIDGRDTCARAFTSGALQDNSSVNPGAAPVGIGADNVTLPALNFAGNIDDLRLYPVALSSDGCDCEEVSAAD